MIFFDQGPFDLKNSMPRLPGRENERGLVSARCGQPLARMLKYGACPQITVFRLVSPAKPEKASLTNLPSDPLRKV